MVGGYFDVVNALNYSTEKCTVASFTKFVYIKKKKNMVASLPIGNFLCASLHYWG